MNELTSHSSHDGDCQVVSSVRFATPGKVPNVAGLTARVASEILSQCKQAGTDPAGLLHILVGPGGNLAGLYDQLQSSGHASGPASTAVADQVTATFKAEPARFAALAFAHVIARAGRT